MQTKFSDTVFRRVTRAAVGLALAVSAPLALAQQKPLVGFEDIDLFASPPPPSDRPNVLLVLDTSANWEASVGTKACTVYADGTPGPVEDSQKAGVEKCGLVNALYGLPVNPDGSGKFNVGLMYLNAANADGAYPRVRFLELTAANKLILMDAVKKTTTQADIGDKASNADISRALWEAYLWYKGLAPYRGQAQTNPSRDRWDRLAFDGSGKYISPAAATCGRNYIILMANGVGNTAEADIQAKIVAAGGNGTKIPYLTSYMSNSAQNNWADETARFIAGVDVSTQDGVQSIITYSLAVTDPAKDKPADWVNNYNYIQEIARKGGGNFYAASDADSIAKALRNIFDQIQAANSVFASASLPVSVNAQGTFLNQVFMGMFRPDEQSRPRWVGNLKQYQFGYNSGSQAVTLIDAADATAINPGTGFIQPGARSFWSSTSDFWKNKQWAGEVNSGGASDSPDGQLVEKGGAAQKMRESYLTDALRANRKVYTSAGAVRKDFDASLSAATLGVANNTERDALVDWVRGKDNRSPSDESGPGTVTVNGVETTATVRATIHGDVIHSSPAVVNYGSGNVIVFYGSNSGMLHAVRGAKTGTGAGQELWSFIPEEFLPKLKRLRDNAPSIQFAATNMDLDENKDRRRKDYAMDGPITFYQKIGEKVYLYAAMRRGGRALYAFNVTDPASPSLLWKVDHNTAGLSALGQTWSEARVTRIVPSTEEADPVIIMGGGYDPGEDSTPPATTAMGNIVVVLNARTGAVRKVFTGIDRPVPAAVATVDGNGDGRMDRAYAVDLGGSVYRMVFPGNDPDKWELTKIADFSASTSNGQKMFYAPAVTPVKIGGKTAFAIQVGTGDREKPLKASGTDNRFFTVLDKGQANAVDINALQEMDANGLTKVPDDKYGCYYDLPNAGEKVVNAVTYTSGYAFFGTNAPTPPSPTSCTGTLGIARSYAIPAMCGPVKVTTLEGGGFPPTAVTGRVLIPPPVKDGGQQVDCETNPARCLRVPVGIGINPPDCEGNLGSMKSAIGATNIYACAPPQRLRRDWSIRNPR